MRFGKAFVDLKERVNPTQALFMPRSGDVWYRRSMKCSGIKFRVKTLVAIATFAVGLSLPAAPAYAGVCDAKAAQLAASQGGIVLSAVSAGNSCRIKILIKPAKGPPRRKTFVVRK